MTSIIDDDDSGIKDFKTINDSIMAAVEKKSVERDIKSRPNYYAILPANVRYDPSLSYLERILYAEITALSNTKGYCYATNLFFAKHYQNSERTISRAINNLVQKGFIFALYETSGEKTYRKLYLSDPSSNKPTVVAKEEGVDKTVYGGVDKTVYHNTTSMNSTSNTIEIDTPPTELTVKASLPYSWGSTPLGKTAHERLGKIYELLYERHMGVRVIFPVVGKNGAAIKSLLKNYCEAEAALMLVTFFEWRGVTGTDNFAGRRLLEAGYPIAFLAADSAKYHAHIHGVLGAKTETDMFTFLTVAMDKLTGR